MNELLDIDDILDRLEWFDGKFESEAVAAAIAHRDEIIPELLEILEEITDPEIAAGLADDGDYVGHLYAMYLLAQFRETRAYPIIVRIALLPSDLLEALFDDLITVIFSKVLASVCGGDLEGIQSIIENTEANEWVRGEGLDSLVTLVAAGVKSREEIIEYFTSLFHGKLTDKNETLWSQLVCCAADLCATDLRDEIEKAYEQELADPQYIGLNEVHSDFAKGVEAAMAKLADDRHYKLVDSIEKEMAWWATFSEEEQRREKAHQLALYAMNSSREDALTGFKRVAPKVGRNAPCPCASGKKYKKCCGQSV
jgi:uncharacterized protein YecA (UPF0149 family)